MVQKESVLQNEIEELKVWSFPSPTPYSSVAISSSQKVFSFVHIGPQIEASFMKYRRQNVPAQPFAWANQLC